MRTLSILIISVALVVSGLATPASAVDGTVLESGIVFPQDAEATHFVNSWGARRSGGRSHTGSDLMAPRLTPAYAIADGTIEKMSHSRLGGWGLWIDHGDGVVSVYLHLNNDNPGTDDGRGYPEWTFAPGLEVGDQVAQGEFVAFVGDSGNAERTAPHTHFELHVHGRKVNPYHYLKPVHDAQVAEASTETDQPDLEVLLVKYAGVRRVSDMAPI